MTLGNVQSPSGSLLWAPSLNCGNSTDAATQFVCGVKVKSSICVQPGVYSEGQYHIASAQSHCETRLHHFCHPSSTQTVHFPFQYDRGRITIHKMKRNATTKRSTGGWESARTTENALQVSGIARASNCWFQEEANGDLSKLLCCQQ